MKKTKYYRKNDSLTARVQKMMDDDRFKQIFKGRDIEQEAVEIAKKRERRK